MSTMTLGASMARTVPKDIAISEYISTFRLPAWSLYLARTTPVIPPIRKNMVCEMATWSGVEPSVRAISGTAGATIDAFNW